MIILKFIILILIFAISYLIGNMIAKHYSRRVEELEDIKNSLNVLQAKIRFAKEPLSKIFKGISKISKNKEIFDKANENMKTMLAGDSWRKAIRDSNTNLKNEDKEIYSLHWLCKEDDDDCRNSTDVWTKYWNNVCRF